MIKLRTTELYIFILLLLSSAGCLAQTTISGKVSDGKGIPIMGANVYLEGTYDGGTTDEQGIFRFNTETSGEQSLLISFLTYETVKILRSVTELNGLAVTLKEDMNTLETVVLSAGSFSAGDNSKINVLK
ncbi:MAG: carboxypeptidase-like regulatory domain-containing protein, partial [Bacteroidia bacterium]|nr:carboxypeptidase-like regulatory domain-containing protein [Bacteroidia bacterium]